jgi:hypothetical protein
MEDKHPMEDLQPGSWTAAEVDALEGRRIRFHNGNTGTIRAAAGLAGENNTSYAWAVEVTPDSGQTILITRGDVERGAWAFTPLPGPPISAEESAHLPEWGHKL